MGSTTSSAVFHTEGGVPWDFPLQDQRPPQAWKNTRLHPNWITSLVVTILNETIVNVLFHGL